MPLLFQKDLKKYILYSFVVLLSLECMNIYSTNMTVYNPSKSKTFARDIFLNNLKANLNPGNIFNSDNIVKLNNKFSTKTLDLLKFSPKVLREIKNQTVDCYPFDMISIFANGLNWNPRPLIQSYVAYTPWLDLQNQKFFLSAQKAPEYLIWEKMATDKLQYSNKIDYGYLLNDSSIDNRYLLNDEPLTIKAIFSNYCIKLIDANIVLFKKHLFNCPEIKLSQFKANWNQWISIPECKNQEVIRASIDIKNNFIGLVKRFLYRNSFVFIDYKFTDGKIITHFLPIKNALSGVWLNPYIVDFIKPDNVIVPNFLLKPSINIKCSLEQTNNNTVTGWAFLNDSKNLSNKILASNETISSDQNLYLVLKNLMTNQVYTIDSRCVYRPDVTAYFHDGHNYDASGFQVKIPQIVPGNYLVGLNFISQNKSYFTWTKQNIVLKTWKTKPNSPVIAKTVDSIRLRTTNTIWFEPQIKIEFIKYDNLLPKMCN